MIARAAWPLGLARLAAELGRDLQREARAAGGPAALWASPRDALGRLLGLAGPALSRADGLRRGFDAGRELERLRGAGLDHVGRPDPRYPARLAGIHDPPFGLFVRGAPAALAALAEAPVVAVVGSRRATPQGRALTRELAAGLARRGAVVVSGLAHGIDAAAHEGALEGGGLTAAVLGCGPDVPYPRRNRALAARIVVEGLLISEYWPATPPAPWRFPARNRIVAGLADAVAVVEAGRRSGALITADFALELGRPVLAVPGWPGAAASAGCNGLLRAGAALLEEVADVLAELPRARWRPASEEPGPQPHGLAGVLYERLRERPMRADELAEGAGAAPGDVAAALALLEVEGLALRGEGQRFWAAPLRGAAPGARGAGASR